MQGQEDKFVESRGIVGGFNGRNSLRKEGPQLTTPSYSPMRCLLNLSFSSCLKEVNITQVAIVLSGFA
jgi:hypothetical protein